MDEQPDWAPRRRGGVDDPERALLAAVRWAVLPTISLPVALASLGAGATGEGLPFAPSSLLAFLALITSVACWLKVVARWQALPRRGDDDHGRPRWWDSDDPLGPNDGSGGPGGITFDWTRFERDFWQHVNELERRRERHLVHASSAADQHPGGVLLREHVCGAQARALRAQPATGVPRQHRPPARRDR